MRLILSCLILAVLPITVLAEDAPATPNAEQTIKDRTKDFDAAWNRHDATAVASFYTTAGNIVTENGDELSGRDGIQQALTDAFNGNLKDCTLSSTVGTVRLIKPDVAIVDSDIEMKVGDAEPRKMHVVSVLVNKDGKWLNETSRAIQYNK